MIANALQQFQDEVAVIGEHQSVLVHKDEEEDEGDIAAKKAALTKAMADAEAEDDKEGEAEEEEEDEEEEGDADIVAPSSPQY